MGVLALLLCGCSSQTEPVWETVADTRITSVLAGEPAYDVSAAVPLDAPLVEAFSDQLVQVYSQEDGQYELTVQTLTSDSLDGLLKELTGFSRWDLGIITTEVSGMPRHDVTWTCAGEQGLQSCRAAILDDGSHYYVLTAAVPMEEVSACRSQVQQFFDSFGLYYNEGV